MSVGQDLYYSHSGDILEPVQICMMMSASPTGPGALEGRDMKESRMVSRIVAGILTAAFLGFVFMVFGVTMFHHGEQIIYSARMTESLAATRPENPTVFDNLAARIGGFTGKVSELMWHKTEMGYLNSAFQFALGKRVINTGSQNMIRLTTGHLYDLQPYKSLERNARDIAEIRETTLKDYPFLFVYEHPTLYDPAMMPKGYDALDHSTEMADEATGTLRELGVTVMDSRDVLPNSGHALGDLLMVTDQHWSTLAAITMAQNIAQYLVDTEDAPLDVDRLDLDEFNTIVHEDLFLGKYGQRVGPMGVTPDDIVEYWPKYDTWISRYTLRGQSEENAEGPFRQSVLLADRLAPDAGRTWNIRAYTDYGLTENYTIFTNPDAPDYTILLLKDSYSAPIGAFMSLLARNVTYVDLRRTGDSLETWVERVQPDAVVMAYSLQMLRDDNYVFE